MTDQHEEFHEIEEKLKQLPKIADQRTKEEIYRQVMAKMDEPKKRSRKWLFIPAVAILLLTLLLPNLLQDENVPNDVAINESQPIMERNEGQEETMIFAEEEPFKEGRMNYVYAIRESDLWEGSKIVTIPYLEPTKTFVVPLSFIIENNDAQLEQVEEIMTHFDPRFIGLENTLLKEISLKENEESELIVNMTNQALIENDHKELLIQSIDMLAQSLHYERVIIEGDDELLSVHNQSGYFVYETNTSQLLLIPAVLDSVTFSETLEKMQEASSDMYQSAIPKDVTFETYEHGDVVTIQFPNQSVLDDTAIEAILLTARQFQFEFVEFQGLAAEHMSRYNLDEPISTKLAPNGI